MDKTVRVTRQKARNEVPWELKDLITCSPSKSHQEHDVSPRESGLFKAVRQKGGFGLLCIEQAPSVDALGELIWA